MLILFLIAVYSLIGSAFAIGCLVIEDEKLSYEKANDIVLIGFLFWPVVGGLFLSWWVKDVIVNTFLSVAIKVRHLLRRK